MAKKKRWQRNLICCLGICGMLLGTVGCGFRQTSVTVSGETMEESLATTEVEDTLEETSSEEFLGRVSDSKSGKIEKTMEQVEELDSELYTKESWESFLAVFSEIYTEYMNGADDSRCDELDVLLKEAMDGLVLSETLEIQTEETESVSSTFFETKEEEWNDMLQLAINVLYNDEEHQYFENEVGNSIMVTEDGQYTLFFDCDSNLSEEAKNAGITSLNQITAIYIKDVRVSEDGRNDSGLVSCDVSFDQILVDGVELEIEEHDASTALKTSGIFDTTYPINSWDGSLVKEAVEEDHVIHFEIPEREEPQTIVITFTLSNLIFEE